MSEIEYKLEQLTNFLGEKKLKQLGLLTCETCNHILAHAEGVISEEALSEKVFLTPQELADINNKLYEAAGIQHSSLDADSDYPSINFNDNSKDNIEGNPQDNTEHTSEDNIDDHAQDTAVYHSEANVDDHAQDTTIYHSEANIHDTPQNSAEGILHEYTTSNSDHVASTKSISTTAYSSWDIKNAEKLLAEILADISSIHPSSEADLGMGYVYNIYPPLPPHSLICTECGKLYAMAHPSLQLMPLPVSLTPTEYELLKGVYVDILL